VDRLHPSRWRIEAELAEREKTLFNPDGRLYLKDLTSTYFTGQVIRNLPARRAYSRGKRGDAPAAAVSLGMDWKNIS
jgi:hypothetical protein